MPKVPMDYSKTHFYKIVCNDLNIKDCYVGHTTNFVKRRWQHKSDCKNTNGKKYDYKIYQFLRDNGNWENWNMILIDTLSCENSFDALRKEREFVEKYNANLNIQLPSRTKKERYEKNKECIKARSHQFYANNKEHCKERSKNYNDTHKEHVLQKCKEYRENNKEQIKLKRGVKMSCDCGASVSKKSFVRHKQTKKHQDYINSLQD